MYLMKHPLRPLTKSTARVLMAILFPCVIAAPASDAEAGDVTTLGRRLVRSGVSVLVVDVENWRYHLPLSPVPAQPSLTAVQELIAGREDIILRPFDHRVYFGFSNIASLVERAYFDPPQDPLRKVVKVTTPTHLSFEELKHDFFPGSVVFALGETDALGTVFLPRGDYSLLAILLRVADSVGVDGIFLMYDVIDPTPGVTIPGVGFFHGTVVKKEAKVTVTFEKGSG